MPAHRKAAPPPSALLPTGEHFPLDASGASPAELSRFLYCAYGSNLSHRQMMQRCPDATPVKPGRLINHGLVFRGVADVVADRMRSVPVGLYRLTPKCVASLDTYEGFPRVYVRRFVLANTEDGPCWTFTYVMRPRELAPPKPDYVTRIRNGYKNFGLSLDELREAVVAAHNVRSAAPASRFNFNI